jgi:hypothetical protein
MALESVRRLFDESRDPEATVEPDDWHPSDDPAWHELDAHDTVGRRRHWYRELLRHGLLGAPD